MIYFMQEDRHVYRVWPSSSNIWDEVTEDYKVISVEQFVQVTMVCQLLNIELKEMHYVDPSTV